MIITIFSNKQLNNKYLLDLKKDLCNLINNRGEIELIGSGNSQSWIYDYEFEVKSYSLTAEQTIDIIEYCKSAENLFLSACFR
jgi:hypothetical protein